MDKEYEMNIYYKHLFPANLICDWLSHSQPNTLRHREFNFTLDINGTEVYERYISFNDSKEMRRKLL
jgi:DNA primase catalytic subunit